MRRLALVLAAVAAVPVASARAADLMVVGRTHTLLAPRTAAVGGARVKVDGKRCRVPARTALAALARTRLKLRVRDYGACGSRTSDAAGLYVASVAGEAERGADGWVYKLGSSAPSVGAADASGRFGASAEVLWFWCEMGSSGCQRTLGVSAPPAVAAGSTVSVRVRAYDDLGRAVPAAGATVTAGGARATAGKDGVARLPVRVDAGGRLEVEATQSGRVRAFPEVVKVR